MPIYVFRCVSCETDHELLRRLGDLAAPDCPDCGGPTRQRLARVGVSYESFGFTSTDKLVADPRGKDFKALRETANSIADSS
jgi:putative FmdB family regulatory protein